MIGYYLWYGLPSVDIDVFIVDTCRTVYGYTCSVGNICRCVSLFPGYLCISVIILHQSNISTIFAYYPYFEGVIVHVVYLFDFLYPNVYLLSFSIFFLIS